MRSLFRFAVFAAALALVVLTLVRWKRGGPENGRATLEDLDRAFVGLVARSLPGVVSIDALPPENTDPRARMLEMLLAPDSANAPAQIGSGAIVSADGHIVTNFHVVRGAAAVRVYLNDGRVLPAKFLGADPRSDIAILKIEAEGVQPLELGDSDPVRIGQTVIAVGNPLGLQETVTQGIISGKGRRAMSEAANEFFQTDAAVNRGNSGGPLIALDGRIIGITNMVNTGGQGIAFAIPSNTVRRVFESIRDHGRFIRPWFGGVFQPISPLLAKQLGLPPETKGALLIGTYKNSPAEAAGLRPGDVITSFNGKPVIDHIDLRNRVAETPVGRETDIGILRDGRPTRASATIAAEPGA